MYFVHKVLTLSTYNIHKVIFRMICQAYKRAAVAASLTPYHLRAPYKVYIATTTSICEYTYIIYNVFMRRLAFDML